MKRRRLACLTLAIAAAVLVSGCADQGKQPSGQAVSLQSAAFCDNLQKSAGDSADVYDKLAPIFVRTDQSKALETFYKGSADVYSKSTSAIENAAATAGLPSGPVGDVTGAIKKVLDIAGIGKFVGDVTTDACLATQFNPASALADLPASVQEKVHALALAKRSEAIGWQQLKSRQISPDAVYLGFDSSNPNNLGLLQITDKKLQDDLASYLSIAQGCSADGLASTLNTLKATVDFEKTYATKMTQILTTESNLCGSGYGPAKAGQAVGAVLPQVPLAGGPTKSPEAAPAVKEPIVSQGCKITIDGDDGDWRSCGIQFNEKTQRGKQTKWATDGKDVYIIQFADSVLLREGVFTREGFGDLREFSRTLGQSQPLPADLADQFTIPCIEAYYNYPSGTYVVVIDGSKKTKISVNIVAMRKNIALDPPQTSGQASVGWYNFEFKIEDIFSTLPESCRSPSAIPRL